MEQSGQFVLSSYPSLYEHTVVNVCHHICCRPTNHLRLANVIGELHPVRHLLVRVRDDPVGKGKVDRRGVIGLLKRCVESARRIGDHSLSVIVELGRRAIGGHDHPQLVRPLKSNLGLCSESEGMTMAARALVEMYSIELHCARGSQT